MITFYSGTDAYRLREAVSSLLARHRESGEAISSWTLSDDDALAGIEQFLKYPSFFAVGRVLVVFDALADEAFHELLREHHAEKLDDIHIIAVQHTPEKPTATQKKRLSALQAYASTSKTFDTFTASQQASWMASFCSDRGRSIGKDALAELVRRCGSDTWFLANELEKLCAYCNATIDMEAVKMLVPEPEFYDQWELSNAAAAHDKRGMLVALFRHTRKGTPPPLLVGMVAGAIRTVLSITDLLARNIPVPAIAQTSGVHPFVVRKHLRGASAYSVDAVRAAHQRIAALDRETKEGRADAIDGLYSIVVDL